MTPERPSDPPLREARTPQGPFSFTDVGRGSAVVAVHGLPGSTRDYRWLGAALEPEVRFLRLDLPGFGRTPLDTMPSPRARERAGFVVRALDALEIERAAVLGHSMGGTVALEAASRWPERFGALALLASVGLRPHRLIRRTRPRLVAALLHAPLLGRAMLPLYRRGMRSAGFRGSYTTSALVHAMDCLAAASFPAQREAVARLSLPTLVAWAEDDPFIEPEISAELSRATPPGPELFWPEGGHNVQKSHAVEIANAIVGWLVELSSDVTGAASGAPGSTSAAETSAD